MISIDFNKPIVQLNGDPIFDSNIGKSIANCLVAVSKGDIFKFYSWGMSLHKGDSITIDKSDYNTLKEFIKHSENMTILLKFQALEILENCKEE